MDESIQVLHVDDEPGFADLVGTYLKREDDRIGVLTATGAVEALEVLESEDLDCIVSDYEMPGSNGIELLEHVREIRPELPFVLYTGKGSEEIASEAVSAGVTDYLQKGSGTEQYTVLANRVVNAVESYRAKRAVEESERRLRSVYERITDGFFAVDTDWVYTYVNEEGARLVGLSRDELLGERVWDVFPELVGSPFGDALKTAMESQQKTSLEEHYPPHDTWYDVTVYPDEDGISIYFSDVTRRREREGELERERNRRAALFEELGEPAVEVSLEGDATVIRDVNEAFEEVFGAPADEVVDEQLREYVVPADGVDEEGPARRISGLNEDDTVEREMMFETPEGPRWFQLRTVEFEVSGEQRAYVVYLDVTDRKQVRHEIETVVDNLPGYVYRHRNEAEWPLEFVRGSAEEVTGYTESELEDEVVMAEEVIHPEDRADVRRDVESGLEETGGYDLTYRIVRSDGEIRWVRDQGDLVEDPVTGREFLDGFVSDVTERMRREQELRRYERIVEVSGDPVYTLDEDGRFTFVNDSLVEMTGYERSEILGSDVSLLMEDEDVEEGRAIIRSLLKGEGERATFEMSLVTADGSRVACENHVALIMEEDRFRGTVGVMRDITERKRREEGLALQNERLEALTSVVSHDLRNPLNVASGRLELAREERDSENLEAVAKAQDRMEVLIDDLLELARQGETVADAQPVDLEELVTDCWANVETGDASLEVDVDGRVMADGTSTKQVFENLFRNAVEHGGGDVSLRVGTLDDGFYVEDDGPGIPEEHREGVFEAGFSTAEGGTGFGLSIVREIAGAHGWSVELTEGAEGGARFEIRGVEFTDG